MKLKCILLGHKWRWNMTRQYTYKCDRCDKTRKL
ncbi:MAG: DUF1660 family phage protein [Solibacillus sp.]